MLVIDAFIKNVHKMGNLILVTGANGFVGSELCKILGMHGRKVRAAMRSVDSFLPVSTMNIEIAEVGDIASNSDWSNALIGVDCVIHCAARAHVMHEAELDALSVYRTVNVDGTMRLVEQAAENGVRRLIYLSSIGVNGIHTNGRGPFVVSDAPAPVENYSLSKWEAEQGLWQISNKSGLEVVIVRPPLVYGSGVKGNFLKLLKLVASGMPLPLGAIKNYRSFLGLENLIDILIKCIDHPEAVGQTFLLSDGDDLSTTELISALAGGMGKIPRLFPIPVSWLISVSRVTGKLAAFDRLVSSLQVDNTHTRHVLDWTPPVSAEVGLGKMADWFCCNEKGF